VPGRIIELSVNGRSLHLDRGFLSVRENDTVIGKVAIGDVDAVIASAQGVTWSGKALAALAERGAPIVFIGSDFHPSALLLPLAGHHDQGRRMRAQASAKEPLKKQLWAAIVKRKIDAQHAALREIGADCERRSGDSTNREAAAAQAYWPLLLGADFRRSDPSANANAFLNYGYAVLRAAAARAVVAAGLHPTLSLHHVSDGDAFSLADDLMEPFRPAIDLVARDLTKANADMAAPETKRALVGVLEADYETAAGRSPLSVALVRFAQSLGSCFLGESKILEFPVSRIPLPRELQF
jgi:CRISP-associated protein Cas1